MSCELTAAVSLEPPCALHKQDGRACEVCLDFEPVSHRLLIVKLAAAGDVLRTTCVLPALRAQYANAQITWITEPSCVPLLEGNEYVDRIIPRDEAVERLLIEEFDTVFGLDADETGAAIAALARAKRRLGFLLDSRGRVRPADDAARLWWAMGVDDGLKRANRRTYPDILYDLCAIHGRPAAPQFSVPETVTSRLRARFGSRLRAFDTVLVLNTGGGSRWEQKKWTPAHYGEFIRLVRHVHQNCAVLVAGGPNEAAFNAGLLEGIDDDGVIDGGCAHSLTAFGALLTLANVVVTSDSLALHMAIALERPVVALVGPTSPWELELYGRGEVVHADVPCLACYHRRCPLPITCMDRLKPEQVLRAVERQMAQLPTAQRPTTQGAPREVGHCDVA